LATYTSKDTQLNSNDPDRLSALKALMSAKYEEKRYYVGRTSLTKAEFLEIQGQNLKAIGGQPNSKSPSASSTHSNPSPLLNNQIRSTLNSFHENGKPRLVSSVTLPDIKPLGSLDPGLSMTSLNADISTLSISSSTSSPSSLTSTSRPHHHHQNGTNHIPPPINFINNLSSTTTTTNGGTHPNNNQFQLLTPWESVSSDSAPTGQTKSTDGFNPDFADFDDAFNNSKNETNNNGSSASSNTQGVMTNGGNGQPRLSQKLMNAGFPFQPDGGKTNGGGPMQIPLMPNGEAHQNGFHHSPGSYNGTFIGNGHSQGHGSAASASAEDKYAALKDLDSLFKQRKFKTLTFSSFLLISFRSHL